MSVTAVGYYRLSSANDLVRTNDLVRPEKHIT